MPYSDDCNHDESEEDLVQCSVDQSMSVAESCENEIIPSEDSYVRNVEVKRDHAKKVRPQDEPPGGEAYLGINHVSPQPDIQTSGWSTRAILAIFVCLTSCCCNVVFLELLVRKDPGIGNLVTFSQFLIISLEGFWR